MKMLFPAISWENKIKPKKINHEIYNKPRSGQLQPKNEAGLLSEIRLRFNIPLDTKQVISGMLFKANLFGYY